MQIGDLDKRVTIQKPTQASDSMGGFTTTWSTLEAVWAAIWPFRANETKENEALPMAVFHRIRIRYRSDVLPSYRILFGTRYFDIRSILNKEEKNEWLDLVCEEKQ